MATKWDVEETNRVPRERPGFDVTATIGRVEFDSLGEYTPNEAAFLLIARHDARGVFSFPMEDGRTMSVTVDYPDMEDAIRNL